MQTQLPHELNVAKSRDHRARERAVSSLRAYILNDMASAMRADFEQSVLADLEARGESAPEDGPAVHKLMRERDLFRLYSSLRCSAQELVWNSVIDSINPNSAALHATCEKVAAEKSKAAGTLTLDPISNRRTTTTLSMCI